MFEVIALSNLLFGTHKQAALCSHTRPPKHKDYHSAIQLSNNAIPSMQMTTNRVQRFHLYPLNIAPNSLSSDCKPFLHKAMLF